MSQIVNRRDLEFVLFELLDMDQLLSAGRYAALDRSSVEQLLDTAQTLAEELFLPCAASLDANEPQFVSGKVQMPPEAAVALRAYAEAGLFASSFDEADGGMQIPYLHDMDSPCSYGIRCARLKTVDRSITEQGESG